MGGLGKLPTALVGLPTTWGATIVFEPWLKHGFFPPARRIGQPSTPAAGMQHRPGAAGAANSFGRSRCERPD
jgi:hypothetical protein